jgi:hypothetical protein
MYKKNDFSYNTQVFNHTAGTWHDMSIQHRRQIGKAGDIFISFYNLKNLPVIQCNYTSELVDDYDEPDGDFSDYGDIDPDSPRAIEQSGARRYTCAQQ